MAGCNDRKIRTRDSSGRENEAERLKTMTTVPSHGSGVPVPEKGWIYALQKKRAFFWIGRLRIKNDSKKNAY
jgi:hypothetical protein